MRRVSSALGSFVAIVVVCAGCRFDAPGESTALGFDDATSPPVDSAFDDVRVSDVGSDAFDDSGSRSEVATDSTTPADTTVEAPPSDTPATCTESGATRFGDHCYFVLVEAGPAGLGVDHATAEADCAATTPPAHLATMNTPGEHVVLDTICDAGYSCWVALQTTKKSKFAGDFQWSTGETGIDGAWCGGYPNDNGLCAAWYEAPPGCYQDVDCAATQMRVACERD